MRTVFIVMSRFRMFELNQMINTSAQILRDNNPAISRMQQSLTLSLSSAISQLLILSELKSMKDLMNMSRKITVYDLFMLRISIKKNQK